MIRVQNKQHIQSSLKDRIRLVFLFSNLEEHVQEIASVRQVIIGQDIRKAALVTICVCRDRGHLRDQTPDLSGARFFVKNFFSFWVERRQDAERADQYAHRVSIVMESVNHLLNALIEHRAHSDVFCPVAKLFLVWTLSV